MGGFVLVSFEYQGKECICLMGCMFYEDCTEIASLCIVRCICHKFEVVRTTNRNHVPNFVRRSLN